MFRKSEHVDEWTEYYEKYSEWYAQYGAKVGPCSPFTLPFTGVCRRIHWKLRDLSRRSDRRHSRNLWIRFVSDVASISQLLPLQDKQLEEYWKTGPANEWNTQRDAFKSSFRGTRMYRMRNGDKNYNVKHFNGLSEGAKAFKALYPKQKVDKTIVDKDAYVDDKDLPENQDPKSMKQRKKDKWFQVTQFFPTIFSLYTSILSPVPSRSVIPQGMVKSGKGCKKCGFVFCRCYGWEYKPSHCK